MIHIQRHYDFFKRQMKNKLNLLDKTAITLTQDEEERLSHCVQEQIKGLTLSNPLSIKNVSTFKKSFYSFDLISCLLYSSGKPLFQYEFGDVRLVPEEPTLVKSRPITDNNWNSVMLPLEMSRHFDFIQDDIAFETKNNKICWRGACHQPWREKFLSQVANKPFCDIADTAPQHNVDGSPKNNKNYLSRQQQLKNKFIFSIEGNDVASNLKWAMNSNSVVMMTKPKFETWFCESRLIPDQHFILIKDDYSDVEERFEYYSARPKLTLEIIQNAHEYVRPFEDLERQYKLGAMVLERYASLVSC